MSMQPDTFGLWRYAKVEKTKDDHDHDPHIIVDLLFVCGAKAKFGFEAPAPARFSGH